MLIYRGVATVDHRLILAGRGPGRAARARSATSSSAGREALVGGSGEGRREGSVRRRRRRGARGRARSARFALRRAAASGPLRVGSKNFTEQVLLGEIAAQALEARGVAGRPASSTSAARSCATARWRAGELDLYPEYTGTAFTAILKEKPVSDPAARAATRSSDEYRAAVEARLGSAARIREHVRARRCGAQDARRSVRDDLGSRRSSGASAPGFGYEFVERADGYPGLATAYGLASATRPREMDLGLLYPALEPAAGRRRRRQLDRRPDRRDGARRPRGRPPLLPSVRGRVRRARARRGRTRGRAARSSGSRGAISRGRDARHERGGRPGPEVAARRREGVPAGGSS